MKRLIAALLMMVIFAFPGRVLAGTRLVYLMNVSGVTIYASGTSTLTISGVASNFTLDKIATQDGYFTVQVNTLEGNTDITSGATFTLRYKESLIDDSTHWIGTQYKTIINGMALSGNTNYVVPFYPEFCGYMRFYFTSGVSSFNNVKFNLKLK